MKIAYFLDGRMPTEKANGYQVAQMCQAFIESANQVTLFTPSRIITKELRGVKNDLRNYYNLRVDIEKKSIFCIDLIYFFDNFIGIKEGSFLSKVAAVLTGVTSSFSFFLYFIRHADKFDVLYLRNNQVLRMLLFLFPKRLHKKIFFEIHSLGAEKTNLVKMFSLIGGVVSVTDNMKSQLIELGIQPKKIIVAHDGVDLVNFKKSVSKSQARKNLSMPESNIIISFVGKFHTMGMEKGIPEIIMASKEIIKVHPKVVFYFVGGPKESIESYENMIRDQGLCREKYIFLDKQPVRHVPMYLWASDMLLMPHPRNEFYSTQVSPLKMFEYMASGRPIIASRLPAIEEVLTDHVNSLLGEAGSIEDLTNNIKLIIEDQVLANTISKNSLDQAKNCSWLNRAQHIITFMKVNSR